jgi:predicted nucleic acid-binding protein
VNDRGDPVVVDASVVIKWYVPEENHEKARAILASERPLLAPDLVLAEVGNILWKKVRRGEFSRDDADAIAERFLRETNVSVVSATVLLLRALSIATEHGISAYDALYVALAVLDDIVVVTADARLVNALARTPLARHVRLLSTF